MSDALTRLLALCERATPGPWRYRPAMYDDWGMVRGGPDNLFVARGYAGSINVDEDAHRQAKTDPRGPNAEFIAAMHPGVAAALVRVAVAAIEYREAIATYRGPSDKDARKRRENAARGFDAALAALTEAVG